MKVSFSGEPLHFFPTPSRKYRFPVEDCHKVKWNLEPREDLALMDNHKVSSITCGPKYLGQWMMVLKGQDLSICTAAKSRSIYWEDGDYEWMHAICRSPGQRL